MRRIVKSLASAGVLLALGACSGGGSVLNFSNDNVPDRVIVTVQGATNLARVLPGAGLPISAVAVKGSQNAILNVNRFKWSAALTTGLSYNFTPDGNQQRACASVMFLPAGPPGVTAFPYTADFGIYIAIDPTNEGNIEFIPPTTIPNPNPIPAAPPIPPGAGTLTTNFPYCVIVTATPIVNGNAGNSGSILVEVANPANPLQ